MSKEEQRHPKTRKLISDLKEWCDQEFGRRSELARLLGCSPGLVTDWIARRRTPDADQAFTLQSFLKKQRAKRQRASLGT